MAVEVLVFGGNKGIDDRLRQLVDGNVRPVLDVELIQHFAVDGVDLGGEFRLRVLDFFEGREAPTQDTTRTRSQAGGELPHQDQVRRMSFFSLRHWHGPFCRAIVGSLKYRSISSGVYPGLIVGIDMSCASVPRFQLQRPPVSSAYVLYVIQSPRFT